MKLPDFSPKNDVESYLINIFNAERFKELKESPVFKDLFEPLDFFNLFWHTRALIVLNKANPLRVLNYLLKLELTPPQRFYLFETLLISFNFSLYPEFSHKENDNELSICIDLITNECKKLSALFPADEIENLLFDISTIKKRVAGISNDIDTLKYLIVVKIEHLQYAGITGRPLHSAFDEWCDLEIIKYEKIIKLNAYSIPVITPSSLKPAPDNDSIKKYIADQICAIDPLEWIYIFKNIKDFMFFLCILSDFFSGLNPTPKFELILQPKCKTRFCLVLKAIYKHFKKSSLKNDIPFLLLLQNLSIFKDQSFAQIYSNFARG